jgi:hypothetical protein
VSAEKWRLLCRCRGIGTGFPTLFSLYMVGYFFNQLLPTSVGGDVVRGFELGRASGRKAEAMASVIIERYTGLTALVACAVLALAVDRNLSSDPRLVVPLVVVLVGYVVMSWLVFRSRFAAALERRFGAGAAGRLFGKVHTLQEALRAYARSPSALWAALGYSFLFYGVAVLNTYAGCLIFGHHAPLASLVVAVPVMLVLFMLPLSIGGIGLQEWAYLFVLSSIGVPGPVALSLGLVFRARSVGFGLAGGLVYLLARRPRREPA